jgi:hypothetical protein
VNQPSLPLDHGTNCYHSLLTIHPVVRVGVEPTNVRLSNGPLCRFAYLTVTVSEEGLEPPFSCSRNTRPFQLVHSELKSGRSDSNRRRPYEPCGL